MATKPHEPWSFEDGPDVAYRVPREYAAWRLDTLPRLPDVTDRAAELVEGYRRLDAARAETAFRAHATTDPRLITTRATLKKEARIAWALWDVVHRHLVAVEMNRLQTGCNAVDDLRLVLMAEQQVEALVRER